MTDTEDLLAKVQQFNAGAVATRVVPEQEVGEITVDPDVMITRSLRVPVAVFDEVTKLAQDQGVPWSTLVRGWIIDAVAAAREADGTATDPVVELDHAMRILQRTRAAVQQRSAA